MKLISINLDESDLGSIAFLVSIGKYPNRSEFIRESVREHLAKEYLVKNIRDDCKKFVEQKQDEFEEKLKALDKQWQMKYQQLERMINAGS